MANARTVVLGTMRDEASRAAQAEVDDILGELHTLVDKLERRSNAIEAAMKRRQQFRAEPVDPVDLVAYAILRAAHGEDYEPSRQSVLDTARGYARAATAAMGDAGLLAPEATA